MAQVLNTKSRTPAHEGKAFSEILTRSQPSRSDPVESSSAQWAWHQSQNTLASQHRMLRSSECSHISGFLEERIGAAFGEKLTKASNGCILKAWGAMEGYSAEQ